jgi:hypothetical protein
MFLLNISKNSLLAVVSTTSASLYAPLGLLHLWWLDHPSSFRPRRSWSLASTGDSSSEASISESSFQKKYTALLILVRLVFTEFIRSTLRVACVSCRHHAGVHCLKRCAGAREKTAVDIIGTRISM